MSINAWKTSFIGLNKPAKVLAGTADLFTPVALWPYANDATDPYWSGGSNPQYYQWEVTFTINDRVHGSNLTRTPFSFNAQDIEVGDFVAGAADGKVLQIMSISAKGNNTLTAVVEDRLRYNTFRDAQGFGLFGAPGPVIFFQINELGFPMLDPVPGEAASDFFTNVMSRFQYMNPLTNYLLAKPAHGFEQGDAICIEDGDFTLSDPDNIGRFIGTVVFPGPGPDQFVLRPANGIIDFVPGLPGSVGDYLYPSLDGTGNLTTSDASRRPVMMKIADAIPSDSTGTGIDPVGNDGDVVEINRVQVTLASGNGTYTIADAVALINAQTAEHNITATEVGGANEVQSDVTLGSAYGVIAGYVPFAITVNGTTVTFTTTTSGSAAYGDTSVADAIDMVTDLNNAKIPNIVASVVDGVYIKLRNKIGGAIAIVNVTVDANQNNFAGANSISSLPAYTPPNTVTSALRLVRADGGPMTLRDFTGQFLLDAGVLSGQNGRYALGLNIEQGLRSSSTSVVANITARDALYALVGDQAHVINDGNGDWAVFLYDGGQWTKVSGKRSVDTDARTLVTSINLATKPTGIIELGTISTGRKILNISVDVENAQIPLNTGIIKSVSVAYNPTGVDVQPPANANLIQGGYGVTEGQMYGTAYQALISPLVDINNDMLTSFADWADWIVVGATGGSYSPLFPPGEVHITAVEEVDHYGRWYLITFDQPVNTELYLVRPAGWAFFFPPATTYTPPTAVVAVSSPTWTDGNATFNVSYSNRTLSVTPTSGGSGYSQGQMLTIPGSFLGTPGQDAVVTVTSVESKFGPASTLSIGTSIDNKLFMGTFENKLQGTATYMLDPNYITNSYIDLIADLTNFAGNTGIVTIKLTYV
jgi:hypothetical protein